MNKNLSFVYVAAGLVGLTLMMALFTFMFSGYLVTYALLPEEAKAYFFEAPNVVSAYGGRPMIGPLTSYQYYEISPGVSRHGFNVILWSDKGIGHFWFAINAANWQDLRTWVLTSPTGDELRRPPCRRY